MRINSIHKIVIMVSVFAAIGTGQVYAGETITTNKATSHNKIPPYKKISDHYEPHIATIAIPSQIDKVIHTFMQRKTNKEEPEAKENRIILHGPHGTGKNKIVSYIAEQTKSKILAVNASSLITTYQNSGADNIKRIGEQIENDNSSIVLFINEADKIGSLHATDNYKATMENTATELWDLLDNCAGLPNILIVLATNNIDRIPEKGLYERFHPENIIKIPCPNYAQRRYLLQHFFAKLSMPKLPYKFLISHIKLLKNYSVAIHKYLNHHFEGISQTAYQLARSLYDNQIDLTKKQRQHALLANLREKNKVILEIAQTSTFASDANAIDIIKEYCDIIDRHSNRVEKYLKKTPEQLSEQHLTWLTQHTAGFSIRDLDDLIVCIGKRIENNNPISEAILQESLEIINKNKTKIAENVAKQERPQKRKDFTEELALGEAIRKRGSAPYYPSTTSVTSNAGSSAGVSAGVNAFGVNIQGNVGGNSGVGVTHNLKENQQNPTLEECHKKAATLPKGSFDREVSDFEQNKPQQSTSQPAPQQSAPQQQASTTNTGSPTIEEYINGTYFISSTKYIHPRDYRYICSTFLDSGLSEQESRQFIIKLSAQKPEEVYCNELAKNSQHMNALLESFTQSSELPEKIWVFTLSNHESDPNNEKDLYIYCDNTFTINGEAQKKEDRIKKNLFRLGYIGLAGLAGAVGAPMALPFITAGLALNELS